MKKDWLFAFRIDAVTLKLLRLLQEKTGDSKSAVIRHLIRQAAEEVGVMARAGSDVAERNGNGEIN